MHITDVSNLGYTYQKSKPVFTNLKMMWKCIEKNVFEKKGKVTVLTTCQPA